MTAGVRRISGRMLARLLGPTGDERPYYVAIARGIGRLILDGRLPTHTRLPAERELAAALGMSRNTVSATYTWLRDHGYLDSRRGAGSWTVLPDTLSGPGASGPGAPPPDAGRIDLGVAAPPAVDGLAAAARDAVAQLPGHVGGPGYGPLGLPEFRHAVARRYVERGLPTTPDQILVTNGALQGTALLMDLLVSPGTPVLTESPTYPHPRLAARELDGRLTTVGVSRDGWDMASLVAEMRRARPRVAYLVPDFHSPTGALMDDDERATVVAEARRAGTFVIVDESVAELAIDAGDQPAPLAAHDTDGRVLSVGSTAKLFWGGLRVGWVRADPPLVTRLMAVRQRFDLASPILEQLVATHLFADVTRIRAERSRQLRAGRDHLVAEVRRRLPHWRVSPPAGGAALWARLPHPTASALSEAAARHGVRIAPGPVFGAEGTLEHHVRLSYTQPPEVLTDAVTRLAAADADTPANRAPTVGGLYI